jgi:hypothetical protein
VRKEKDSRTIIRSLIEQPAASERSKGTTSECTWHTRENKERDEWLEIGWTTMAEWTAG